MKTGTKGNKKHFRFGAVAISATLLEQEKIAEITTNTTASLQQENQELKQEETKAQERILWQPERHSELQQNDICKSVEQKAINVPEKIITHNDNSNTASNNFVNVKEMNNNFNTIEVTEIACNIIAEMCESLRREEMAMFVCCAKTSTLTMYGSECTFEHDMLTLLRNRKVYMHICKPEVECSTFVRCLLDKIKCSTRWDAITSSTTVNEKVWEEVIKWIHDTGCMKEGGLTTSTTLESSALPQVPYAQMYNELEQIKKYYLSCHPNVDCTSKTSLSSYWNQHESLLSSWSHILEEIVHSVALTWIGHEGNTALHKIEETYCNSTNTLYDWVCNVAKEVLELINTLDDMCRTCMDARYVRCNSNNNNTNNNNIISTEVYDSNTIDMSRVEFDNGLAIFDQCLCANTCFLR